MTKSTASEYNTGHQLGAYLLVTVSNASAPLWLLQRPFLISFFVLHLSCATLFDTNSFSRTVLLPNTDGLLAYDFVV